MKKKQPKERLPLDPLDVLDIGDTTGIVSATESTGIFPAMPERQEQAEAVIDIINAHAPIVPNMRDEKILSKKDKK